MHGVKRTATSAEAIQARKQKERAKIDQYLLAETDVFSRKSAGDYTTAAFDATTNLLGLNPELYTVWNYRRNILLRGLFPTSLPHQVYGLLTSDLGLTLAALHVHPKVYWLWNHRQWCLANIPEGSNFFKPSQPSPPASTESESETAAADDPSDTLSDTVTPAKAEPDLGWRRDVWARELATVEKMLDRDARNYHAWKYRRYVLASLPDLDNPKRLPSAELAYTTRKIEQNFSNFSAWHQRTKVLGLIWDGEGKEGTGTKMTQAELSKQKDREFELVQHAMWTDPNDQSVWLYHRWLIGKGDDPTILKREIKAIEDLLEEEENSKWCLQSLVHYKSLLAVVEPLSRPELIKDCMEMLSKLASIDPQRKRRYQDLAAAF